MELRFALTAAVLVFGACALGAPGAASACPMNPVHAMTQSPAPKIILAQDLTDTIIDDDGSDDSMDDIGENPDASDSNGPGDNMSDDGE